MALLAKLSIRHLKKLTQTLWTRPVDSDIPCAYHLEVMGVIKYINEKSVRSCIFNPKKKQEKKLI